MNNVHVHVNNPEDLAKLLDNLREILFPFPFPNGCGGRDDADRVRYTLQAEAYKTCAASLKAAAAALRLYQAQMYS